MKTHSYNSNGTGKTLTRHRAAIKSCTVLEAITKIASYYREHTEICSLYAVVSFLEHFPEAKARIGYVPAEKTSAQKPNRVGKKFVLILDGNVYDLIEIIANKRKMCFNELLDKFGNISFCEFCKRSLEFGEVFTILPTITYHENENFEEFLFENPEAVTYSVSKK